MGEASIEVVRRAVEAWNRGDQDQAFELFAEDAEVRSVLARKFQGDDVFRGHEGVRAWMAQVSESLQLDLEPTSFLAHGDYVLLLGTACGTALSGGPGVTDEYAAVCRLRDGRITLFESHFDHADALISLGERIKAERR